MRCVWCWRYVATDLGIDIVGRNLSALSCVTARYLARYLRYAGGLLLWIYVALPLYQKTAEKRFRTSALWTLNVCHRRHTHAHIRTHTNTHAYIHDWIRPRGNRALGRGTSMEYITKFSAYRIRCVRYAATDMRSRRRGEEKEGKRRRWWWWRRRRRWWWSSSSWAVL